MARQIKALRPANLPRENRQPIRMVAEKVSQAPSEFGRPVVIAGERLYRMRELVELLGISRPTVYRYIKAGNLPKPVHLSSRCIAWRASEINIWMSNLAA